MLTRLGEFDLTPIPENYELWYAYFAETQPEVVRAIDVLIANKQTITDERCYDIYERFIVPDHSHSQQVKQAGDQIQETIRSVNSAVDSVRSSASEYNERLEGVSQTLQTDTSPEIINKTIQVVLSDTHNMIEKNKELEHQLSKSTQIMQEMQRDLEIARKEATTDSLTGLANRKAFDEEIRRIMDDTAKMETAFTLVLMDIDHFKNFNDSFGHQVGDQVLKLVAKTLTDGIKGRDIAARYGGEEFALILPDTDLQGGVKVANHLRNAVASKDVVNRATGEKLAQITMSGGVSQYVPGESLDELIARADAALYTAKHNGRNQVVAAPKSKGATKTA